MIKNIGTSVNEKLNLDKLLTYVPTIVVIYMGHKGLAKIDGIDTDVEWAFTILMAVNAWFASKTIERCITLRDNSLNKRAVTATLTMLFAVTVEAMLIGITLYMTAPGLLFYLFDAETQSMELIAFAMGMGFSIFNVSLKWSMVSAPKKETPTFDLLPHLAHSEVRGYNAEVAAMVLQARNLSRRAA